jgi:predicted lipid-binding transport protein (Tim44 family)
MQDGFDPITLVFIGLAIFVAWRLYGVLGQKTGQEKPPEPLFRKPNPQNPPEKATPPLAGDNVIALQPAARYGREQLPEEGPRWGNYVTPESPQAQTLDKIAEIETDFDLVNVIEGAKYAYEAIVVAFASNDRKTLKELLSKQVFEEFQGALSEREKAKHMVETTFVSLDKTSLEQVVLKDKTAQLTFKFHSKLISCTRDQAGVVIEGNPKTITDVVDTWTFARTLGSRDPNWQVIETGGDV